MITADLTCNILDHSTTLKTSAFWTYRQVIILDLVVPLKDVTMILVATLEFVILLIAITGELCVASTRYASVITEMCVSSR